MNFDFLNNITLEAVETKKTTKKIIVKLPPNNVDLRVFANGKIYPSEAFAKKYELDFSPRVTVTADDGSTKTIVQGCGLDIFKSEDWHMWPKEAPSLLFATVIPKSEPKVALWGSCQYDTEGAPKSSIMTQGTNTFSKTILLNYLKDVLNVVWEATEFVDLVMAETAVPSPNDSGVFYLPKTVTSGPRKGEPDAVRREGISIFPLVLAEKEAEEVVQEQEVVADIEITDVETVSPKQPDLDPEPDSEDNKMLVADDTENLDLLEKVDNSDAKDWAAQLGAN
jgi:hypothetical protein